MNLDVSRVTGFPEFSNSPLELIINEAWKRYCRQKFLRHGPLKHVKDVKCHQQPTGSRLCGFYCAYHMLQLKYSSTHMKRLGLDEHPLDKSSLGDVREGIATFLMKQVITAGGKSHADETVWANIVFGD